MRGKECWNTREYALLGGLSAPTVAHPSDRCPPPARRCVGWCGPVGAIGTAVRANVAHNQGFAIES